MKRSAGFFQSLRQGDQPVSDTTPRFALDVAASDTDYSPWLREVV